MNNPKKIIIYQILTRLFGNKNQSLTLNGNRTENGCGKMNDITTKALSEIKKLGITHVWYTGIIEHAMPEGYPQHHISDGNPLVIKGKAGSPYAITDYYDVHPDLAENIENRMSEFEDLVKRTHQSEMKVLIDFIPNHVSRLYHSDVKSEEQFGEKDNTAVNFDHNNNFYYIQFPLILSDEIKSQHPNQTYEENPAKATGNDKFTAYVEINDWYETVKLNYGVDYQNKDNTHFEMIPDTWKKMLAILLYWAERGIDGFRCDMAEMVPVAFWQWAIARVKTKFPHIIFIAEVYQPNLYRDYIETGGFDYLYDKVGLYDTLRGVISDNKPTKNITQCWQQLEGMDKKMLRFLENHDEQRIASRFFCSDPFKAIPATFVSATLHQGPFMIYFGQEVGEPAANKSGFSGDDGRTTIFDYWHVPEHQKWMNNGKFDGRQLSESQQLLRKTYQNILSLSQKEAIISGQFYDLMYANEDNPNFNTHHLYAYLRYTDNEILLLVANFSDAHQNINIKIPQHAFETMSVNIESHISLNMNNQIIKTNAKTIIEKGIEGNINPFGYLVIEMYYKL